MGVGVFSDKDVRSALARLVGGLHSCSCALLRTYLYCGRKNYDLGFLPTLFFVGGGGGGYTVI